MKGRGGCFAAVADEGPYVSDGASYRPVGLVGCFDLDRRGGAASKRSYRRTSRFWPPLRPDAPRAGYNKQASAESCPTSKWLIELLISPQTHSQATGGWTLFLRASIAMLACIPRRPTHNEEKRAHGLATCAQAAGAWRRKAKRPRRSPSPSTSSARVSDRIHCLSGPTRPPPVCGRSALHNARRAVFSRTAAAAALAGPRSMCGPSRLLGRSSDVGRRARVWAFGRGPVLGAGGRATFLWNLGCWPLLYDGDPLTSKSGMGTGPSPGRFELRPGAATAAAAGCCGLVTLDFAAD